MLHFAQDIGGPLVYKPLADGGLCRRVSATDLGLERLRRLASAPVMFQAEIPGRNIRVYVVGGSVVASYEVVSDELDYRGAEKAVLRVALGAEEGDVWMARFPTLAHFLHDTSDPRQAASAGMGARVP